MFLFPLNFRWVITGLVASVFLSACIGAVPIPWFPDDPHEQKIRTLERYQLDVENVVKRLGPPWAVLDDSSYVYISSATGSKLLWFYGWGVPYTNETGGDAGLVSMTDRDYILMINFDDSGVVSNYEIYKDSFSHNHCFDNEICFKPSSLNTPLAPGPQDELAKRFDPVEGQCVFYLFRDSEGPGNSSSDYVDISINISGSNIAEGSFGASVEGGYFRWVVPPRDRYRVFARYHVPADYPFVTSAHAKYRNRDTLDFSCDPGEIKYIRLYVANSLEDGTEFDMAEANFAQTKIKDLNLLLNSYRHQLNRIDAEEEQSGEQSSTVLGRLLANPGIFKSKLKIEVESDQIDE
jgi:hypothetical protein